MLIQKDKLVAPYADFTCNRYKGLSWFLRIGGNEMSIAGLDIGSTGAKITVADEKGNVLHTGYMDYPVSRQRDAHEMDASLIWDTVQALLTDAATAVTDIQAVGITSFGESFVLLDENDQILYPTMMYTDPRGEEQAHQLSDILGAERISDIAGTLPHPMFSLPKLMWIKQRQPEVFRRVKHVFLMGDFIAYMLTGQRIIDYSLAARTMGFNIRKLKWSRSIFEAADINSSLFSHPVPSGSKVGSILPELAATLNLPESCTVVICGHDQIAASVGSNAMSPGIAANGAGTVECITPVFTSIPENAALQRRNYSVVPFLNKGNYCCYAFSFAGGSLIEWFLSELASGPARRAMEKDKSIYKVLEHASPDEPTGILVLPHFAGAATPYMDTGSQGAFLGLKLSHTNADLYRAVMEGITYEMMLNLETLSEAGVRVKSLNASGGCARSEVWLQMKADILGIPVTRLSIDEAGTVGGLLFTGVAIGLYKNLDTAAEALVKPLYTYQPRMDMHDKYQKHYQRYRQLYSSVRHLMDLV